MFTDSLLTAPQKAPEPMVTWIPLFPLPGNEIRTMPSSLAKTRTPAIHTSTLPTANPDAEVEGLCHGLLLPMDADSTLHPVGCMPWGKPDTPNHHPHSLGPSHGTGQGACFSGQCWCRRASPHTRPPLRARAVQGLKVEWKGGVIGQVITHSPFQGIIIFISEDVGLGKQGKEITLRDGAGAVPGCPLPPPTAGHT